MRQKIKGILLPAAAGIIMFIPLLGLRGLCEPDEGRYAEVSREITETGDWITPRLNYIKHFHKPPLVYWCTAVSFLLLGKSEFSARLPAAVFGILGLIITYRISVKMNKGTAASLASAIALACTAQYFVWTQILASDLIFSFFILLAIYGFWIQNYMFYIGMALAFMVKGPAGVIIPLLIVTAYGILTKRQILRNMRILKGTIIFLFIAAPWFTYVCIKNPGLLRYFVFDQSLNRLLENTHGRGKSMFYFIPVILAGGMPWIPFLPQALKEMDKEKLFLAVWAAVPFIFFSCSKTKLPGYILPIYPALALLAGRYFAGKKYYRLFSALCIVSAAVYLAATAALPIFEERLGSNLSIRRAAEIINRHAAEHPVVINYRCFLQGLPFYLGRKVVLAEKEREVQFENSKDYKKIIVPQLKTYIDSIPKGTHIFCFTQKKDLPALKEECPAFLYTAWETDKYLLLSNYED